MNTQIKKKTKKTISFKLLTTASRNKITELYSLDF